VARRNRPDICSCNRKAPWRESAARWQAGGGLVVEEAPEYADPSRVQYLRRGTRFTTSLNPTARRVTGITHRHLEGMLPVVQADLARNRTGVATQPRPAINNLRLDEKGQVVCSVFVERKDLKFGPRSSSFVRVIGGSFGNRSCCFMQLLLNHDQSPAIVV